MDRFEARAAVKEELRAQGRIVAEKIPYIHAVGHCSRSDDVIEPRLSTQWFVKVAPLAKAAGDAVRDGRTVIHPAELAPRYFDWVDNMHDWCISRQLWWGHRIPVWYGPDGEIRCVGPDEVPPGEGWTQDPDVLDTWFSSGMWPFSTMGWPEQTDTLKAFYPTSVLVTGYDILFFWVVRMMMFGLYATRDDDGEPQVPFHTVALHGLVRDQYGKKMSKSKGNTVDPLQWIEDYGADAVRFTLARGSNPGADQAIATEWVAGSGRFCSEAVQRHQVRAEERRRGADRAAGRAAARPRPIGGSWTGSTRSSPRPPTCWAISSSARPRRVSTTSPGTRSVTGTWNWRRCRCPRPVAIRQRIRTTQQVLGTVLDGLFRLLHPFVPFVTETLWTALTGGESPGHCRVADAVRAGRRTGAAALVGRHRPAGNRNQAIPGGPGAAAESAGAGSVGRSTRRTAAAGDLLTYGAALTRLEPAGESFAASATLQVAAAAAGTVTVAVDTSSTIDVAAEIARAVKDLAVAEKEVADTRGQVGQCGVRRARLRRRSCRRSANGPPRPMPMSRD